MTVTGTIPPSGLVSASNSETHVVVAGRADAATGIVVLTLESESGEELPIWTPGAHVDLVLGNGMSKQYSLCGDPADRRRYRVAILREPEGMGGSRYIHEELTVGSALVMRGPRNHFPLVDAERYVFVAGGIGITPILPMLSSVHADGKEWELHYAGRSADTMAFREELTRDYGERVQFWVKSEGERLDLARVLGASDRSAAVYCCGPSRLSDAALAACSADWPVGAVHIERFVAKEIDDSSNTAFTIRLEQSGLTLLVPPEKSTLQVMEEAGVHVQCSCAVGTCGTCETYVLEGIPEHRDSVLTDEEKADNTSMMVCVSRAKSPLLVLDI